MEANNQQPLLNVHEKDEWFWEKQTVKELFRWRSAAIGPKMQVFLWSTICFVVGLFLWALIESLMEAESIHEMILDTLCIVVVACGGICYLLVPVMRHIRKMASRGAATYTHVEQSEATDVV